MVQMMRISAYLWLFVTTGCVIGMDYEAYSIVTHSKRPQIHSFYRLVTTAKLNDEIFSDYPRLTSFGDINTRYNGFTPLHILMDRPDATIQHVKALLNCGADINIPATIKLTLGRYATYDSYKAAFVLIGDTPPEQQEDRSSLKQYLGNPEVVFYVFETMLKQKVKKVKETMALNSRLENDGEGFFIVPLPCKQHDWPEMGDDEARNHLKTSVKDQKDFELFIKNLPPGALDVFFKMQKMMQ